MLTQVHHYYSMHLNDQLRTSWRYFNSDFFLPRYMLGKGSCSVASALIEMERKTDGISLMT